MDLTLLDGVWEVVDQGYQNILERECLLDISTAPHDSYGAAKGSITTFYLTPSGNMIHDKVYSWSIRYMENYQPLLDLVLQGMPDGDDSVDDIWEGNYYYRITKLTDTHMWWQVNTNGDNSIIKFHRH